MYSAMATMLRSVQRRLETPPPLNVRLPVPVVVSNVVLAEAAVRLIFPG